MAGRKTGRRDSGGKDEIDVIVAAWRRARPDLDFRMFGILLRMQRFDVAFRLTVEKMAKSAQVKSGDLFVLLALRRAVPDCALRPTDLFRTLLVTSGAMTKRIDRLVALGYVERIDGTGDRRSWLIHLTREGHNLADNAIFHIARIVNLLLPKGGLPGADPIAVEQTIQQMHAALVQIDVSGVSFSKPRT